MMSFSGMLHIIGATSGLVLGAVVIFAPKLGKLHRTLGLGYLFSMLAVNVSALSMYHQTGEIGAFHLLAVVSLVTLGFGYREVARKRKSKGWLERHGVFMSWSYVGLVAAGVSQYVSHYVPVNPTLANIVASTLISLVGGALIFTLVPRTVRGLSGRNKARRNDQRTEVSAAK